MFYTRYMRLAVGPTMEVGHLHLVDETRHTPQQHQWKLKLNLVGYPWNMI